MNRIVARLALPLALFLASVVSEAQTAGLDGGTAAAEYSDAGTGPVASVGTPTTLDGGSLAAAIQFITPAAQAAQLCAKLQQDEDAQAPAVVIAGDQETCKAALAAAQAASPGAGTAVVSVGKKYAWNISLAPAVIGNVALPTGNGQTSGTVTGGGGVCIGMDNSWNVVGGNAAKDPIHIDIDACQGVAATSKQSTGAFTGLIGPAFEVNGSSTLVAAQAGVMCLEGSLVGVHTHCMFALSTGAAFATIAAALGIGG